MQNLLMTLRLVVVSMLVCCVGYGGVLLLFGQTFVPHLADGSMIEIDGRLVGSSQVAQPFEQPDYFWPRPSAVEYAGNATGGSNLSPANPLLRKRAETLIARLAAKPGEQVPTDLVAASGSGIDPHITLAAAMLQAPRVAAARNMPLAAVEATIDRVAEAVPMSGERLVNVLQLNLVLDAATVGEPLANLD